ncbi:hypothetical protein, partial [Levilactobacillus brevis]|uniref:hypothetical protein n=1 Tax=Levilactobacillus brevis TaxID=1580 RepID=UPI0021A8BF11
RLGVVIGMPRFVFPQIIPEFLVFRQSLITDSEPRTQAFYASLGFREVLPQDYGRAFVLDRRY